MAELPFDDNPFAPPIAEVGDRAAVPGPEADPDAELVRRHHLMHEASIKAVGLLGYLLAGFCAFVATVSAIALAVGGRGAQGGVPQMPMFMAVFVVAFYGATGTVCLALGYGLRRLQAWARWTTMVLSMLSLLSLLLMLVVLVVLIRVPNPAVVAGFLLAAVAILGYIFYLVVAPKAGVIFSPEYRLVIARTPGIRTRTSRIVKVLVGVLVALVLMAAAVGIARLLGR